MRNPLKFLIASAAMTAAGVCSLQAADLAVRPYYTKAAPAVVAAYDWSGLYLGLNGGYATARGCWSVDDPFPAGCHNASGATVGGQIGYRWQLSNFVFGVEGQGNWADLSGSNVATSPFTWLNGATNRTKIDSFALATGSVGVTMSNVLLYVKGGGAYVNTSYSHVGTPTYNPFTGTASESRWNPAAGAGVEIGFAQNWTIGVEYDHVFQSYKDVHMNCTDSTCGDESPRFHMTQDLDMALVRLNYRFGGPVVAKY